MRQFTLHETTKGHWYHILDDIDFPEGDYLPSVTTITDYFPNKGLDFWMRTSSPEEIEEKSGAGLNSGSKTHACANLLINGQVVDDKSGITDEQIKLLQLSDKKLIEYLKEPLNERESACLDALRNFWDEYKPITIANEIIVYSKKYGYAGTLDWVGYLLDKKTGKYSLWILDWKISKQHSRSNDLQVSAYLQALCETYKKTFRANLGICYLGRPSKTKFLMKPVKDRQNAFTLFLNTRTLWADCNPNARPDFLTWKKQHKLDLTHAKTGKIITLE